MTVFERVCGVLNDSGIAHALIGASALAARGVARSTSAQLASDVTADLAELPSEMRERWQSLRA